MKTLKLNMKIFSGTIPFPSCWMATSWQKEMLPMSSATASSLAAENFRLKTNFWPSMASNWNSIKYSSSTAFLLFTIGFGVAHFESSKETEEVFAVMKSDWVFSSCERGGLSGKMWRGRWQRSSDFRETNTSLSDLIFLKKINKQDKLRDALCNCAK